MNVVIISSAIICFIGLGALIWLYIDHEKDYKEHIKFSRKIRELNREIQDEKIKERKKRREEIGIERRAKMVRELRMIEALENISEAIKGESHEC